MTSFLERYRAEGPVDASILEVVQDRYPELPEDALEEVARQLAAAQPMLRRYHVLHDKTPDHAMARATAHEELDEVLDEVVGIDFTELGDGGFVRPEYQCPNCQHEWSGAPNSYTGWGDKVYVPKGRLNKKGGLRVSQYGTTSEGKRRGWGNSEIDEEKPKGGKRQRSEEARRRRAGQDTGRTGRPANG